MQRKRKSEPAQCEELFRFGEEQRKQNKIRWKKLIKHSQKRHQIAEVSRLRTKWQNHNK